MADRGMDRAHSPRLRTQCIALASLFLACSPAPTTGPGEIKWDRQICEHCQMVISERPHAVQLRATGERAVHAFDDLGCALLWLDASGTARTESPPEIWVRDPGDSQWIDARGARFEKGHRTPMQYGWATSPDGIALQAVLERVRETERRRKAGLPVPTSDKGSRGG